MAKESNSLAAHSSILPRRTPVPNAGLDELLEEDFDGFGIPLGRLLHDAARLRRYAFDVLSAPNGLTRAQYSVLAFLKRTNNPGPTQTEMANALQLGKVTLGVTLERLEDKAFVIRKPAANDGRLKIVFLTQKGREALESASQVPSRVDQQMMLGLEPDEQRLVTRALAIIRDNLLNLHNEQKQLERQLDMAPGRKEAA